jgi:hypothetical protein
MTKPTNKRSKPAPDGLKAPGKALWREVTAGLTLRSDELAILAAAARTADQIAGLEKAATGSKPLIRGSRGQDVLNPLVPELRQQRALLAQLLSRLDIPEDRDGGEWDNLTASQRARKAAGHRYGRAA